CVQETSEGRVGRSPMIEFAQDPALGKDASTSEIPVGREIPSYQTMAAPLSPPRLLPSGDSAVTVEFSRNIDDEANRRVLALDRLLAQEPIAGVRESIPTYRSLLVHYDPVQIDFTTLGQKLV